MTYCKTDYLTQRSTRKTSRRTRRRSAQMKLKWYLLEQTVSCLWFKEQRVFSTSIPSNRQLSVASTNRSLTTSMDQSQLTTRDSLMKMLLQTATVNPSTSSQVSYLLHAMVFHLTWKHSFKTPKATSQHLSITTSQKKSNKMTSLFTIP